MLRKYLQHLTGPQPAALLKKKSCSQPCISIHYPVGGHPARSAPAHGHCVARDDNLCPAIQCPVGVAGLAFETLKVELHANYRLCDLSASDASFAIVLPSGRDPAASDVPTRCVDDAKEKKERPHEAGTPAWVLR